MNLPPTTERENDERLAEILEQYLAELHAGRAPSKVELLARYPDLADELKECLASLDYVGSLGVASDLPATAAAAGDPQSSRVLGDFRILREVGRGGMGLVYEAEQISLRRRVALKVLPFAGLLDPRHRQRFTTEAQAAALLHHQNIVPVYQVGCERGVHYYAMQYVDGQTLADVIRQLRNARGQLPFEEQPTPTTQAETPATHAHINTQPFATLSTQRSMNSKPFFDSVVRLGIQAAEALEHAHQAGIVHRDIKPGNLLIDAGGKLWITDFGLARMETDHSLTVSGDLMGTIRYMSPEQALGKSASVDHRTDIYSLGVTLYELLTLQSPITGEDRAEMLHQIAYRDPPAPRRINRRVPVELNTIVLKAISKSPDERYATAQKMADDLQRFLDDQPIQARRPTWLQRAQKWRRRHRHVVNACLLLLMAILVTAGPLLAWHERRRATRLAEAQAILKRQAYVLGIGRAHHAWQTENNVPYAQELLDACQPGPNDEDLRGFEHGMLRRLCEEATRTLTLPTNHMITSLSLSSDSRYLAACGADLWVPIGSDVTVWDLATNRELHLLPAGAHCVTFSADGKTILTGHHSRQIRRWSVATGEESTSLQLSDTGATDLRIKFVQCSPDGQWLAASSWLLTPKLFLLNLATGDSSVLDFPEATEIHDLAFSPDSQVLVVAGGERGVNRWSVATGQPIDPPWAMPSPTLTVAFSSSGKLLASGHVDGGVILRDAHSGMQLAEMPSRDAAITAMTFVGEDHLALGKVNKTVTVWKWSTDKPHAANGDDEPKLRVRKGHGASIFGLAFLPSQKVLISADKDRRIKLWDLHQQEETSKVRVSGLDWGMKFIDFSPDSRTLSVAGGRDWRLWALPSLAEKSAIAQHAKSVMYSPDGQIIATTHFDPARTFIVKLWDATTRELLADLPGSHNTPSFSPNGDMLVTGYRDITLWNISNPRAPRKICNLGGHGHKCGGAFFPKTHRIAAGSSTQTTISIWDATSQKRLAKWDTGHYLLTGAISPDERWLALGTTDMAVQLWDVDNGRMVPLQGHGDAVYALDFSPDGKTLASGSADHTVKLWNAATGLLLLTLDDHHSPVRAVRFSPDGQYLATGSADGTILVRRASRP